MQKLEEVNKRRDFEFKGMNDEITMLQADYENRKVMVPGLAKRFQFYQDLRGYVTDLVECLDEKVGLIKSVRVCLSCFRNFINAFALLKF